MTTPAPKQNKTPLKRLSYKEKEYVKQVAKGKPGVQAALTAYDTTSYKTASNISSTNLDKPRIQEALNAALVKHEITLDKCLIPIHDALEATTTTEAGEQVIAHTTRMQASDRALRLLGVSGSTNTGNQAMFLNVISIDRDKYKL